LYDDKDHHTNGNTNSQPRNIYNSVAFIANQVPPGDFQIIFKHDVAPLRRLVVLNKFHANC
jgi:hypothetical protein